MRALRSVLGLAAASMVVLLPGCGGSSPPAANAQQAVRDAVFADNPQAYSAGADGADVVNITIASWKREPVEQRNAGLPPRYETTWTATLRLKEPVATILEQVNGVKIVKVHADKSHEIPFHGTMGAMHWENKWEIHAFSADEPWKPLFDSTGGLPMGYQVHDNGNVNVAFRNTYFVPLSRLQPCVVEGSDEWKKMVADAMEKQQREQAAYAERRRQQQEEAAERQRQQQAAYDAEQKRLADARAEQQRQQQLANEEAQRKAQEEAKKRAEAARVALLTPTVKPFQSATGLSITHAVLGPALGALITEATVDESAFTVKGRGIDLSQMPFREFTFESSTDDRGVITYKSSLAEAPIQLRAAANNGLAGAGVTFAPVADADRSKFDATLALGQRLGTAAPLTLTPEIIEPAALAAKEATLQLAPLTGAVVYLNRLDTRVNPLFVGDLKQNRQYVWRDKQVVSLRLPEPVKGAGLYYRGYNPTENLVITINGVHTVTLANVAKLGAAVIPLPADLEILDIHFEAQGIASARTIGLIK